MKDGSVWCWSDGRGSAPSEVFGSVGPASCTSAAPVEWSSCVGCLCVLYTNAAREWCEQQQQQQQAGAVRGELSERATDVRSMYGQRMYGVLTAHRTQRCLSQREQRALSEVDGSWQ